MRRGVIALRRIPIVAYVVIGSVPVLLVWRAAFRSSPESAHPSLFLFLGFSLAFASFRAIRLTTQVIQTRRGSKSSPETGHVIPATLPPTSTLVGREDELALITGYLGLPGRADKRRVIGISGEPGIGKTALAINAARLVAADYFDGVLYASAGGQVRDKATRDQLTWAILGDFIASLQRAGDEVPQSLTDRKRRFWDLTRRPATQLLVVIDDAPSIDAVEPLMPAGAGCAVIVTSREILDIKDARLIALDALSGAESLRLLATIIGASRVEREPEIARDIAEHTAGSPLALHLAGAGLAVRRQWRLAIAAESMRQLLPPRNKSDSKFARAIDLSFAMLPELERRAVLMLGLFDQRTFAPWMLAALLDEDEPTTWRICDRLVDARLLDFVMDDASGVAEYHVLEQVQAYAWARRAEIGDEAVRREARVRLHERQEERGERNLWAILSRSVYPELEKAI